MHRLILALLLCFGVSGAEAKPLFARGGHPGGGGAEPPGELFACGTDNTDVCATHKDGQTFVQWPDVNTGSAGNNWRMWMHRSTSPLNSGNCGAGTLIASYIPNNSGQLYGGNPDTQTGTTLNQTNRQDPALPMVRLSDMGAQLAYGTGLQVYTALAAQNAYYCVIAKPCPSGVCSGGSDTYIGAVGPIAETVAPPKPIKFAASGSRPDSSGDITSPTGRGLYVNLHASGSGGGLIGNSRRGDCWSWWNTTEDGNWQDGMQSFKCIDQAAPAGLLVIQFRDTVWNPLGTGGIETFWSGLGMTPNTLVGPANRRYIGTEKRVQKFLSWSINHYGLDPNKVFMTGQSMGAMGAASTGMRMTSPKIAGAFIGFPVWRMYERTSANWAGNVWTSAMPFRATVAAAPSTLGTDPGSVLLPDGTVWGGASGYENGLAYIAADRARQIPAYYWSWNKGDQSILPLQLQVEHQIEAINTFQTERRVHGTMWNIANHGERTEATFNCGATGPDSVCVPFNSLALNVAKPAFSNSSHNDNVGTGARDFWGTFDGDPYGHIEAGYMWTITTDNASAFSMTVSNPFMSRTPVHRISTLTSDIAREGNPTSTVADGAALGTVGLGPYFLIQDPSGGNKEYVSATVSGNDLIISAGGRGLFGTEAQSHATGDIIQRMLTRPLAPNAGPFSSTTTDIAIRDIQNFTKGKTNGQVVSCNITPHGGSLTTQTPTVAHNFILLLNVTINASGVTTIACS